MYSIGQVSAMTNLPISTLRYYDKEGFFPNLEKQSGIRRFSQAELDAIRMIECLKRSGLEQGHPAVFRMGRGRSFHLPQP